MNSIQVIAKGFNVTPLVTALQRQPNLWNRTPFRTESSLSPHRDMPDIVVRYNDMTNFENRESFNKEHDAVWYPVFNSLPQVRDLVFPLMYRVEGERLGMVLITNIPPGKQCYPHTDGGWHANYYDKYVVQLQSHPDQAFHFDDCSYVAEPGDVYWFDNSKTHWVTNDSPVDRLSMIVCIKSNRS